MTTRNELVFNKVKIQPNADIRGTGKKFLTDEGNIELQTGAKLILPSDTPTDPNQAVSKQYTDALISGLDVKQSVRAATTTTLPVSTYNNGTLGFGATITGDSFAALGTIDGQTMLVGERILVKNQSDPKQNGIYDVTQLGNGTSIPFILTRSTDADNTPFNEVSGGMFTFVEDGTVNSDYGFNLYNLTGNAVLGTDNLQFSQFSGAGSIVAGNGLTQTGNVIDAVGTLNRIDVFSNNIDIAATYVGQTSLTTLGTITTGTWNATTIATTRGGTGLTSYVTGDTLYASAANVLSKLAIGTNGQVMFIAGGLPSWYSLTTSEVSEGTNLYWTQLRFDTAFGLKSTTDLAEGTNLYFTDARARLALSGTTNRISYNNTSGVIDIAATYVGQTSITTLGTVTVGKLSTGAKIGGVTMELGSDATGDLYYNNTGVLTRRAIGSTNDFLKVIGGVPTWEALSSLNVTTALGYTPVNKAGDTMTGFLTLSADPTSAMHAATKQYVDNVAEGLDVKKSVRVATTADITLSGTQTIDGIAVIVGDRVLVKNQTIATENGIYVVSASGWSRSSDADNSPVGEVTSGMFTFVAEGTMNGDYGWVLVTNDPITLGTTSLSFTQFSGAGSINSGDGLSQIGNTFNVNVDNISIAIVADTLQIKSTWVGQTSITTLGTITTGTWNGTTIAVANGGTGQTTFSDGIMISASNVLSTVAGTANSIVKFGAAGITLANSLITEIAGVVSIGSKFTVNEASGNLSIGTTSKFTVDGSNGDLDIGLGNFTVDGATGDLSIGASSKFTVDGATGTTDIGGGSLIVDTVGNLFKINTDKFVIDLVTGYTTSKTGLTLNTANIITEVGNVPVWLKYTKAEALFNASAFVTLVNIPVGYVIHMIRTSIDSAFSGTSNNITVGTTLATEYTSIVDATIPNEEELSTVNEMATGADVRAKANISGSGTGGSVDFYILVSRANL